MPTLRGYEDRVRMLDLGVVARSPDTEPSMRIADVCASDMYDKALLKIADAVCRPHMTAHMYMSAQCPHLGRIGNPDGG